MTSFFRLVEPEENSVIEIDGINILKMPLGTLRSHLTCITQMPVLLSGTIRSNVDPFGEHSDDRVIECLNKCQLVAKIASKKKTGGTGDNGKDVGVDVLHVRVQEGGSNFSAGERQLICVARALLAQPKLLLLDEASSNIDPETDAILQTMIRCEFKECTKLIIAHRINTIIDCDKIIVLDKGSIVECDVPKVLLGTESSHFSKLVDACGEESAKEMRRIANL